MGLFYIVLKLLLLLLLLFYVGRKVIRFIYTWREREFGMEHQTQICQQGPWFTWQVRDKLNRLLWNLAIP